jgi:hypothetical protein
MKTVTLTAAARPLDASPAPRRVTVSVASGLCAGGVLLLSLAYVFAWYRHANGASLWMDEILATATARLPRDRDIVAAIWAGAEFSPPSFDLLLHTLGLAAPGPVLPPRLPSLVAVWAAALVVAATLRPATGAPLAVLGFGLTLAGGLFYFAIQARPYALLALCMALALWLWLGQARHGFWGRPAALWAVAAVAISLHVYGVLVPVCIGTAELAYAVATRRTRWPVWLALLALLPVLAAWAPLYLHLVQFNAGDNQAPGYYGRPRLPAFARALGYLLVPHNWRHGPFALGGLVAVAIAVAARVRTPHRAVDDETWRWRCVLLALAVLPFAGFLIGRFVTGSFAPRYISPVALWPALFVPYALRDLKPAPLIAACLVLLTGWAMIAEARSHDWAAPTDEVALVLHAPAAPGPIVIDQAQIYIQLVEALPPAARARCVFVVTSAGIARPDPTNENQLRRLAGILPHYRLLTVPALLVAAPEFLVIYRPDQPGTALTSLRAAGARFTPLAHAGGEFLLLGQAP